MSTRFSKKTSVFPALTRVFSRVYSVGRTIMEPIWAEKTHVDKYSNFTYILQGSMTLYLGNKRYRAKSGDILLIPAGVNHRDGFPVGTSLEVFHIFFEWQDISHACHPEINRDFIRLPATDKKMVREMVFNLYDVFRGQRSFSQEMTDVALHRLLMFLISAAHELHLSKIRSDVVANRERRKQMIQDAKLFISENLDKSITLSDIAEYLGISAYRLSHLFSQESGFTFSSYISQARMQKAAELLSNPGRRISEAAYAVGFEDPSYFSRVFRNHFNESPGRYRSRLLRKTTKKSYK